ncbi:MAG: protein TolQ [Rhodospirillaceae bacterium]|nr:protein TolQ [Rhodospirillaceae bacterium]MYH38268.1 protein TolQ [Rhodospirillaceae bacterium]MYK14379.1 protein TolQ [Rhodospirillaceae bacterium]
MDLTILPDLTAILDPVQTSLAAPATDGSGARLVELAQATAPEGGAATDEAAKLGQDRKVVQTDLGGDAPPADDFSVLAVIERADWIVKGVIAVLVVASIWSWAVIFEKLMLLHRINGRATRFENRFWAGGSVDELYADVGDRPNNPMAAIFAAAMREWKRSTGDESGNRSLRGSLGDRIDRVMHVTLTREMSRSERFLGSLASIGATAPFVGLFGTVWGIMRAFQDIAIQKNTNLATVAPGIAEALFATALGLLAAIPAVVAYNKLSGDLDRYAHRLEGFSGEFSAIVSRELDNSGG